MASMSQRHPMDAPLDVPVRQEKPAGLLTRFVPARLQHSKFYSLFLRLTRVLQFLSSVISLGIFSQRFFKVYRLVNSTKTRRGVNGSYGAVEGILAAAVLYTLITTLLGCVKKNSSPGTKSWLRWLWVVLDLLFMGAFIAVAVITSPNGGMAGPRHCYSQGRLSNGSNSTTGENVSTDDTCNLPWGTFILGIISTLLHAITASFHEVRDRRRRNKLNIAEEEKAIHTAPVHNASGHVSGAHNGSGPVGHGQTGHTGNTAGYTNNSVPTANNARY
ncbi:uncharacterized protein LY79DRAFT_515625 [Colletotrichum navitas]|uniref:MARVEL domain-containing protein n=1 Tax=Colletotrichum navitas TaxID=681940 RepID=A0AAD8PZ45_9PEZI|nr:uncharacterized protein LY79DRAFT_515625 [Colletotrichum navitas]KAK1590601.1 hypothetical protein LY79DRAFT_515625 [Colletotrichum navitas]